jgi:hypothetical protein
MPELAGKLNGLAIRVPTPNVSIVDLVVTVEKAGITVSDVNEALKAARKPHSRVSWVTATCPWYQPITTAHPFLPSSMPNHLCCRPDG